MVPPKIKNFHLGSEPNANEFFILNHSAHIGLPCLQPVGECFSVQSTCMESFYFYFAMSFAFYKSSRIKMYRAHTDSPFLLMSDLRTLFQEIPGEAFNYWSRHRQLTKHFNSLSGSKSSLPHYVIDGEHFILLLTSMRK